ncbi:MAG: formate--tetrahydrofolate ligase [Christensenellales bacterium]
MTDIEIARAAKPLAIGEVAQKLGVPPEAVEPYGKYKAKLMIEPGDNPSAKLILVTATHPTPYGEGKTTLSVGLSDGIARLNKKVCLTLREPSLGPVFGTKGGAAGGGRAQVIPMEDINLHFTGDFHAVSSANNLLSALIDNHIKQGNKLNLDLNRIEWKRCIDLNDRALREIECGLGGEVNGVPRKDGFVITAASEVMAILCLARDMRDLKERLADILIGYDTQGNRVTASMLGGHQAMAILLKDALAPNLVQTLEGTPAIIHGGPFANIAHGCNSIRATKLAMSYADYVVSEAGFGADLGAEKFIDIKCRTAGLTPSAAVIVTTIRALKHNGGGQDLAALGNGLANLGAHIANLTQKLGLPSVVAINRFSSDTAEELETVIQYAQSRGVKAFVAECWEKGGIGCLELAKEVTKIADSQTSAVKFAYPEECGAEDKISVLAKEIYGAGEVIFEPAAKEKLAVINNSPYRNYPVCVAKTQYSFSADPALLGRPQGFTFNVKDLNVRAGARFIVAVCGKILLMPGLSERPAANSMTIDDNKNIDGLF